MTPNSEQRNDTRLLLAIAALVVAGAAGLTILVGLRSGDDPTEPAAVATLGASDASPARAASVEPARYEVRSTPVGAEAVGGEKIPGSTSGPEIAAQAEGLAEPTEPGVSIDPDVDPLEAGQRAWHAGEYRTAVAYFEADAAARPAAAYTHYLLGLALWKAGRAAEAVAPMERSAELNPRSIRTFLNLARIRSGLGDPQGALAAAEQALGIDAESAGALYQQARALRSLGRVEQAVDALERGLALRHDSGEAHNLLGLIRLERGEWLAALESFESAARLVPQRAYVQNNLGLALERAGRLEEAVAAFRRAVELDADHAAAAVSLARVEPLVSIVETATSIEWAADAEAPETRAAGEPEATEVVAEAEASRPGGE